MAKKYQPRHIGSVVRVGYRERENDSVLTVHVRIIEGTTSVQCSVDMDIGLSVEDLEFLAEVVRDSILQQAKVN